MVQLLGGRNIKLDGVADFDFMFFEPALIDFKDVQGGPVGEVLCCGLVRRHFFNIDDFSGIIDKGRGERHPGVFHPESSRIGIWKDKQHAMMVVQAVAMGQST